MTGPDEHLGEAISALADGELAPREAGAAHEHLARCPVCAGELAATVEVRSLVRSLPVLEPRRVLRAVPAEPPSRRWVARSAAAAAAVAVLLLAAGVREEPPADPMAQLVRAHTTSLVNADPVSQVAPAAIPVSFDP